MNAILEKLRNMPPVRLSEPRFKTYRLMYRFGAWVCKARISAENDDEALHDAREAFDSNEALQRWPYEVALYCGDRQVALLKEADKGMYQ